MLHLRIILWCSIFGPADDDPAAVVPAAGDNWLERRRATIKGTGFLWLLVISTLGVPHTRMLNSYLP